MTTEEKLEKFKAEFEKSAPRKPMISVTPYRGKTTVFSSKFGGVPYFPKGAEYPTAREGELAGRPLYFLAQINFSETPRMEGFPTSGILQFFAGCDGDDVIGADFDDETNQNGFRVIYHECVIEDKSRLMSDLDIPKISEDEYMFPFRGEFALEFSPAENVVVSSNDFRFYTLACKAYNAAFGANTETVFGDEKSIESDDGDFCDMLFDDERFIATGSRIGGFPFFTQYDPREEGSALSRFDTLLLQIDSEGSGDDEIIWGDCGVAGFFINSDDLRDKNFGRVLYNWDCC